MESKMSSGAPIVSFQLEGNGRLRRKSNFTSTSEFAKLTSSVFHYFKIYLNVCYFLLIVPFRIKMDGRSYVIHTNKVQKIFSTILITLIALYSILNTREVTKTNIKKNPDKLFVVATAIHPVGYSVAWIYVFWWKQKYFFDVMDACGIHEFSIVPSLSLKKTFLISLLCILPTLKNIADWISTISSLGGWKALKDGTGRLWYYLYLQETPNIADKHMTASAITTGIGTLLLEIIWCQHYLFVELFPVLSAMMAFHICKDFSKLLETESDINKVGRYYAGVKTLLGSINEVTGSITVVYLLSMIPSFSHNVFTIFNVESFYDITYYAIKYGFYHAHLVIAAEAHNKASKFRDWLFELQIHKSIDDDKPSDPAETILFVEATTIHLGLQGCGFFTITYGFIGTMMGLIATYAIIMLQFKVSTPTPILDLSLTNGTGVL